MFNVPPEIENIIQTIGKLYLILNVQQSILWLMIHQLNKSSIILAREPRILFRLATAPSGPDPSTQSSQARVRSVQLLDVRSTPTIIVDQAETHIQKVTSLLAPLRSPSPLLKITQLVTVATVIAFDVFQEFLLIRCRILNGGAWNNFLIVRVP